jgi:hypothetical protein
MRASDAEHRELWLGLRFSIGLCLAPVIAGLALRSAVVLFAVVPIGAWAGFSARHPFDYVWNGAVRHLVGAPALPPNPARRRHAFKLATVWLAAAGVLLAVGATTAALVLGGLLVAASASVSAPTLCLPSEALALWERLTTRDEVLTT